MSKTDLFELILAWRVEIDEVVPTFNFTKIAQVEEMVSNWLYKIRTLEKAPIEDTGQ